jgi:hypothetical protein
MIVYCNPAARLITLANSIPKRTVALACEHMGGGILMLRRQYVAPGGGSRRSLPIAGARASESPMPAELQRR